MITTESRQGIREGRCVLSRCGKIIGEDISATDIPDGWVQFKSSSYGGNEYITLNPSCVCGVVGSDSSTTLVIDGGISLSIDQPLEDVLASLKTLPELPKANGSYGRIIGNGQFIEV